MGQDIIAIYKFSIKIYLSSRLEDKTIQSKSHYLFVSVAFICFVLTQILLSNICILHCLVPLNSLAFFLNLVSIHFRMLAVLF